MKPLAGHRIVDLTHALAGPFCTYQLGLLGAEVIKVETPGHGDDFRAMLPDCFDAVNGGKQSLTLDLTRPEGNAILHKLLDGADILIENSRPGVAAKLGLDWADLHARYPRLIFCSISGFGQEGPRSAWPAIEWSVQAAVGTSASYLPDSADPRDLGIGMLDVASGMSALTAILAALLERSQTGEGRRLDVTMADAALTFATPHVISYTNGKRTGLGPRRPAAGRFRARDRRIFISALHSRWFGKMDQVLGKPSLLDDPRFATPADREANADALLAAIEQRLSTRDAADWQADLLAAGVPSAAVTDFGEMLRTGYFQDAGIVQQIESHASGRTVPVVVAPLAGRSVTQGAPTVPALGEDSDAVLASIGLSESEREALRAAAII